MIPKDPKNLTPGDVLLAVLAGDFHPAAGTIAGRGFDAATYAEGLHTRLASEQAAEADQARQTRHAASKAGLEADLEADTKELLKRERVECDVRDGDVFEVRHPAAGPYVVPLRFEKTDPRDYAQGAEQPERVWTVYGPALPGSLIQTTDHPLMQRQPPGFLSRALVYALGLATARQASERETRRKRDQEADAATAQRREQEEATLAAREAEAARENDARAKLAAAVAELPRWSWPLATDDEPAILEVYDVRIAPRATKSGEAQQARFFAFANTPMLDGELAVWSTVTAGGEYGPEVHVPRTVPYIATQLLLASQAEFDASPLAGHAQLAEVPGFLYVGYGDVYDARQLPQDVYRLLEAQHSGEAVTRPWVVETVARGVPGRAFRSKLAAYGRGHGVGEGMVLDVDAFPPVRTAPRVMRLDDDLPF